jgi:predicted CXXCH cytochrome family protein
MKLLLSAFNPIPLAGRSKRVLKSLMKALISVMCLVLYLPLSHAQGVVGSKHDLSSTQKAGVQATTQVCVFCHTPHGSSVAQNAPLWNKTYNGGVFPASASVSTACLTCHDGTQTTDTVINSPGVGGFGAAGGRLGDGGDGQVGGKITGWAKIGSDLNDDHPVGMLYAGLSLAEDFKPSTTLPLYNSKVECATCHNPHLGTAATFLRQGSNSGSQVCLACHTK